MIKRENASALINLMIKISWFEWGEKLKEKRQSMTTICHSQCSLELKCTLLSGFRFGSVQKLIITINALSMRFSYGRTHAFDTRHCEHEKWPGEYFRFSYTFFTGVVVAFLPTDL